MTIELLRESFDVVQEFVDDSHLVRRLFRCKECGHLYFYEFYEEIDWKEGKDGQYSSWIPVDDVKSAEELSRLSPMQILAYPSIQYDFMMGSDTPRGPEWNYNRKLEGAAPV